jgi:DNA-binding SARP family transcriptional activator
LSQPPVGSVQTLSLHLLGPFRARRNGRPVVIPNSSARILAYVALHAAASRCEVAGALWPDVPQARASSDLRTALWRLQACGADFVDSTGQTLSLREAVVVDVDAVIEWTAAALSASVGVLELSGPPQGIERELLPGWDDEWLEHPRERIRLLGLQAFESVAERLLTAGRAAEALPYLLRVTQMEPLRESAQQLMLELHLRQRNVHEAVRHYQRYRTLVRRELGIEPGIGIRSLISRYIPGVVAD